MSKLRITCGGVGYEVDFDMENGRQSQVLAAAKMWYAQMDKRREAQRVLDAMKATVEEVF